jgi:hypothetical protein
MRHFELQLAAPRPPLTEAGKLEKSYSLRQVKATLKFFGIALIIRNLVKKILCVMFAFTLAAFTFHFKCGVVAFPESLALPIPIYHPDGKLFGILTSLINQVGLACFCLDLRTQRQKDHRQRKRFRDKHHSKLLVKLLKHKVAQSLV